MPYPDDRQPPRSLGRLCGDAAGIPATPDQADTGSITTAEATQATTGAVPWALVDTKVGTGGHRPHKGAAVSSGVGRTPPGARGPDPRQRPVWPDNGGTPLDGQRSRQWQ